MFEFSRKNRLCSFLTDNHTNHTTRKIQRPARSLSRSAYNTTMKNLLLKLCSELQEKNIIKRAQERK